ncbi:MAG: HpcH/HpaI aldolase/citrate lyase family protein [Burkholderiales bacterium]|nr:HpcH/HpaI aldolase/citrate lyase family protein [Burkholderiales bacterium]
MEFPVNQLKRNLRAGKVQIGCWVSLGGTTSAEICAGAGFDWILVDMEHSPNDLPNIHQQLHAASGYPCPVVVRAPWNDTVMIKRLLDVGVQSLLIPNVQSADEARRAVAAVRYPPQGVRGVTTNARSNRFGRVKDYFAHANEQVCLILQVETRAAVARVEEMAAVDGVDALFVGPQDLAADYGHLGNPGHPEVQAAIGEVLECVGRSGKAPGLLNFNEAEAKAWIARGMQMLAVTSDQFLLARETSAVAARYKT